MKHDLSNDMVRSGAVGTLRGLLKFWRAKQTRVHKPGYKAAFVNYITAAECALQALGADPDDTTS